jgi:hypothetical protein
MDKAGRGEDINFAESLVIRQMIANRTWPEAPEITARSTAIQQWALRQPEDASIFTDPEGWSRGKTSDSVYQQLTAAGQTDQDTPHTEASERFRQYWNGLTPEQQQELPVGRWTNNYFKSLGYDMRSDEQRSRDEAYQAERERKSQAALEQERAAAEERKRAEEAKEKERQDWFKDNWAKEDQRLAEEKLKADQAEAQNDRQWKEFVNGYQQLPPEDQKTTRETMSPDQLQELDKRVPVASKEEIRPPVLPPSTPEKRKKDRDLTPRDPSEEPRKLSPNDDDAEAEDNPPRLGSAESHHHPGDSRGGPYEEDAGWASDSKGSSKLTYTKDSQGDVTGGYWTHYDSKGNVTGKEYFKENSPSPASTPSSAGTSRSPTANGSHGDARQAGPRAYGGRPGYARKEPRRNRHTRDNHRNKQKVKPATSSSHSNHGTAPSCGSCRTVDCAMMYCNP